LSQFKKYHLDGNLKFNNLDISQSLKLRYLMGKIIRISLELNFTPNTLGCYGLMGKLLKTVEIDEEIDEYVMEYIDQQLLYLF